MVLVLALVIAVGTWIASYRGSSGGLLGRNRAYDSPPGSLSGSAGVPHHIKKKAIREFYDRNNGRGSTRGR